MPVDPRSITPGITRRTMLGGGALLLAGAGAGRLTFLRERAGAPGGALRLGYDRLCVDLAEAWWDSGSNTSDALPGIRSTDGTGGWNTGRPNFNDRPASVANARGGSFWQAAQYLRFLSNDRQMRTSGVLAGDPRGAAATARILDQRRLWHMIYSAEELASDGTHDGTVNASDDAAWKLQALKAIHQATGAAGDLAILRSATVAVLSRYADRFTPAHRRTVDGLSFSAFGCLYALPGQDRNGQGRSTTYETGIMDVALYLARMKQGDAFRTYARTVYDGFQKTLQRPSGIYFQTLQLDPAGRYDGTPFLRPIDANKPVPRQDFDGVTIGGTMGMAVVASELFRQTGDGRYRRDVARIVGGIATEYLQNGRILCDRDPWTAGIWGYDFASRALAPPGVDPGNRVATALGTTASTILSTRTPIDTHAGRPAHGYSAEWSGNTERSVGESRTGANDGVTTWKAFGAASNNGRGGGQASPNQIMTSSSAGIMVQAAVHLNGASG